MEDDTAQQGGTGWCTLSKTVMQNYNEVALKSRILYGWANLYKSQLKQDNAAYSELVPVIAIWVLNQNIFRNSPTPHHRFQVADLSTQVVLSPHLEIHTLELDKWRKNREPVTTALHRWLEFLAWAESWREVPVAIKDPVMEEAMGVLETFQRNQDWNDAYRCRLDGIRRHRTQVLALEQAQRETEQAQREAEQERAAKEQAQQEVERERTEKERERTEKEAAQAEIQHLRQLLAQTKAVKK